MCLCLAAIVTLGIQAAPLPAPQLHAACMQRLHAYANATALDISLPCISAANVEVGAETIIEGPHEARMVQASHLVPQAIDH